MGGGNIKYAIYRSYIVFLNKSKRNKMTKLLMTNEKALSLLEEKKTRGTALIVDLNNIKNLVYRAEYESISEEYDKWFSSVCELLNEIFDNKSVSIHFSTVIFEEKLKINISSIQKIKELSSSINLYISKIDKIIEDVKNDQYQPR